MTVRIVTTCGESAYFSLWYTLVFETLTISGSDRMDALIFDGADFDAFTIHHINHATSDPTVGVGDSAISFRFSPDAFSGVSVPTSLDPALFMRGFFFAEIINIAGVNGVKDYVGGIETFERAEVPEPPVWALLGIGSTVLIFNKTRRGRTGRFPVPKSTWRKPAVPIA